MISWWGKGTGIDEESEFSDPQGINLGVLVLLLERPSVVARFLFFGTDG